MAPTLKNSVSEIARAVIIAGILTACSTIVLASRLEERVRSNRESAETALTAAITLRKADQALLAQKDAELERGFLLTQTAQKELIAIVQGLAKDNASFREEAIRRLTSLDARIGYLAESVNEIKQRK